MTLEISQNDIIEEALIKVIENYPDKSKSEIFAVVEKELKVPRASIRRVKGSMLAKWQSYIDVLK